jgi:hypothetical protein
MQSTVRRLALGLVLAGVVLTTDQAWARMAKVTLNSGQEVTGEVASETPDAIVLVISGIRTPFKKSEIKAIADVKSLEEQYAQKRGTVADDDIDGRYALADWLYSNNALDLAKRELDDLVKRAPDNPRIALLQRAVVTAMKLRDNPAATTRPSSTVRPPAGTEATPVGSGKIVGNRLTEEQINLLKVYLVDLDKKPGVFVPNEVMDKAFKDYAQDADVPNDRDTQEKIKGKEGYEKLRFLFGIKTAAQFGKIGLYEKVKIQDDSPTIVTFRNFHKSYIVGYCATADCHGGAKGGSLILYRDRPDDADTVYTNLWILLQYANRTGFMFDFAKPEFSLLIQEGLARANAAIPHPDVPGWQQNIGRADDQDPKYKLIIHWMADNKDLLRPMTGLPIPLKPPVPANKTPTTQPSNPPPAR